MRFHPARARRLNGFSFAEVCIAIVVCVLFGAAAFTTNQRLLLALKSQKETTAATMMLQERMEKLRSFSYSDLANASYVQTNLLSNASTNEAALGNVTEYLTVSGYLTNGGAGGNYPGDGTHANKWSRTTTGISQLDTCSTLATDNDLLKIDLVLTWTTSNGRTRTREIASVFGKGNIGQ